MSFIYWMRVQTVNRSNMSCIHVDLLIAWGEVTIIFTGLSHVLGRICKGSRDREKCVYIKNLCFRVFKYSPFRVFEAKCFRIFKYLSIRAFDKGFVRSKEQENVRSTTSILQIT